MFSSTSSSSRSSLSPQMALVLANSYLELARTSNDRDLILARCEDAEAAIFRIKRATRNALIPPKSVDDQMLCNGIYNVYLEQGNFLNSLGCHDKAKVSIKKAEKWRFTQDTDGNPASSSVAPSRPCSQIKGKAGRSDVAHVPPEIFPQNVARPAVKYDLPKPDDHIASTPQLACCLGLLSRLSSLPSSPPSSLFVTAPNEPLDEHQRAWVLATTKDVDEQERLHSLAKNLTKAFIDDSLKGSSTVAEIVHLAPILEPEHYRKLLGCIIDGIGQETLLDFNLLEGLAQLLQGAAPGYLLADDLVKILRVLNMRLKDTHQQSTKHLYQLVLVVSHVLDAMADCNVKSLNREQLHALLSAYLNGLKSSSDPYLVYQAAYAHQALQYVPDDETPLQSVLRRTRVMVDGVSGILTSFKNLNVSGILDGLGQLHEGATEVFRVVQAGFEGASSLINSGEGFLNSLKEGLSFSRKRAWYPALRAADTLLRDGRLEDFKRLVCEASCRRDPAFEWGLCQRLGEIAANPLWDANTRQSAIKFLGEIYKNDVDWDQQASVKQWILTILIQLSNFPESAINSHAQTMLQELENNGDAQRQALYHVCINGPPSPYPLKVCSPPLASPSLISRVQNIPDVEDDLRKLKVWRLAGRGNGIYIPPQAKASLQLPNDVLFPLLENVEEFLSSDRQVLLLLGESGAGKSIFNRELECELWNSYKKEEGRIPLHISLPAIDKPDQDLIRKHLLRNDFTESQIQEMKYHRKFILVCDGYDESRQTDNLYESNQLNQPGQWQAKMVISCRAEYLPKGYRDRFQPIDQGYIAASRLFQEAVIVPFSVAQIQDYINQYVSLNNPLWQAKDYMEALNKVPNLLDLVKNPFLLTLSLEVLPRVVDVGRIQDFSGTKFTRVALYDEFVEQWLERSKIRTRKNDLSPQAKTAFNNLVDGGFTQTGIHFLKRLAASIYKEQAGHPVVEYMRFKDERTWKSAFFGQEDEIQLLREACPLIRNGNQYRFIHQSLLEYCFTLTVFDPQESKTLHSSLGPVHLGSASSIFSVDEQAGPEEEPVNIQQSDVDHPLTCRSFVGEPSILEILAERVQQEPHLKQELLAMIERSKTDKKGYTAAANAITILVRAGIQFNGADLRGIRIPGANLTGGVFDSAQLQGADLRKVNLRNIWLRQADISEAQMAGVQFGEWPYLTEDSGIYSCAYSPDGRDCAIGLGDGAISVYDTTTWAKIQTLSGHTRAVTSMVYSPSGQQIASGSAGNMVRLWDAQTGAPGPILSGHEDSVKSVVYSPSGQQIASGSDDKTVRSWDTPTGASGSTLSGHTNFVTSVVYSPNGQQIASHSEDKTVQLWDTQTGAPGPILSGHTNIVTSVVYSPSGQQIASGSVDKTVRLWDTQTGAPGLILRGHTRAVTSVVYSSSGQKIISGSWDNTVRMWDTQTGAPGPTLSGHTNWVTGVVFSPSGQQIASGSADNMVQLWDAQTGAPGPILSGHKDSVRSVVYSPNGQQIASGSDDKTVRLWDTQTGAPGPILSGHTSFVTSVVYSPNGQQIASHSEDKTVRLWDAQTGAPGPILNGHTNIVTSVVYSPSGQQIASGSYDSTVRLWDTHTGASGSILRGHTRAVTSVVYSPSGQKIISGSWDKTVRMWDAQTGAPGPILNGHTNIVTSVAFSPSGQQIASGSADNMVRLWDAQVGAPGLILSGHKDSIRGVVYSPSGPQIASGCRDKTVQLWDTHTGASGSTLIGHTSFVTSVVYSPNGQQIASGSWDKMVRLWDAQTGAPGPILSGHTSFVTSVMYSPCGQRIASGSQDFTVRLWDVESGQCVAVVEGFHGSINSIAWYATVNGSYFATGCGDKSVRIWQMIEEGDQCHVRLHWSSTHDQLVVSGVTIQDAQGLSNINMELLKQRGAVGEPILPSSFRGASEKLISMASTVSQL